MASTTAATASKVKPTIPVKYEFMGSLRRSTIGLPPKLRQVRKKLAKSFPEFAHLFEDEDQLLRLIYTDDEGDEITITTNDELLEAYRLAQDSGKVLRFTVPDFEDKPARVKAVEVTTTAETAIPVATAAAAATNVDTSVQAAAAPTVVQTDEDVVRAIVQGTAVHFGKTCAKTGVSPILGRCFRNKLDGSFVCEAAIPTTNSDDFEEVAVQHGGSRIRVPRELVHTAHHLGFGVHRGVMCDVTGMQPILGCRYKRVNKNFDLCTYAFNLLTDTEKAEYRPIIKKPGQRHRGFGFGFGGHGHGHGPWRRGGRCGGRFGHWRHHMHAHAAAAAAAGEQQHGWGNCAAAVEKPVAQFVKDMNVDDNSRIAAGQEFVKGWVMRAGPTGIPTGCSVVFVGGSELNAKDLRVPLDGPIEAGAEFVVSIPFKAPKKPEHYRSFWRLQTAEGLRFGPRIWADIMVTEAKEEPEEPVQPVEPVEQEEEQVDNENDFSNYSMKFCDDITVPDGSTVEAGKKIRKTWLVSTENGWGPGCRLRCTDMFSSFTGLCEEVPAVPAGVQADVSITLTAPKEPGHYRTYWGMFAPNGDRFGETLFVDFNVAPGTTGAAADARDGDAAVANGQGGGEGGGGGSKDSTPAAEETSKKPQEPASAPELSPLERVFAMSNKIPPELGEVVNSLLDKALQSGDFAELKAKLGAAFFE